MHFRPHPSWLKYYFYQNRSQKSSLDTIIDFNWVLQNNSRFQSLLAYKHMFIAINNWRNTKRTTYKQRKACISLYKGNNSSL